MKGEYRQPQQRFGFAVVVGICTTLAAIGVLGLLVVYTGAFNVAASEEHASFTRWAFDTTFRNSIEARSADIVPPDSFTQAMAQGASEYKAMCQHCHGGPGVERDEWARGLRPHPPHLTETAEQWRPREVFWLVKHGARMTGMPAFGPTHDDRTLWSIVAFVKELPAMTAGRYASLGEQQEPEHEHRGTH
jgi:mono/diheme cytochrome c family protein